MINILSHKHESNIKFKPYKFSCSCGCSFESDEYSVTQERCINGRVWFEHICPDCRHEIKVQVSHDVLKEYVYTEEV